MLHDIPATDIKQHFKQQMYIIKHSSRQVSYCYTFRHRNDILTHSDKTKNIIHHTKLVIESPTLKKINVLKQLIT